jgi:hypothetical protein
MTCPSGCSGPSWRRKSQDRRWNTDVRHQANGYEHQWRVMRPGSRRAIQLAEASRDGKRCDVADQTLTVMQRFTRRWSAMTAEGVLAEMAEDAVFENTSPAPAHFSRRSAPSNGTKGLPGQPT